MEMFSSLWMQKFMDEWNSESELITELFHIGFNSTIAYGFADEYEPRGVLVIEKGRAVSGAGFENQKLNWDLRAAKKDWQKWFNKAPGMMALGMAYTARELKFVKGDYISMIKDPSMAGPFIKSFAVMARV